MKKLPIILLTVIPAVILSACTSNQNLEPIRTKNVNGKTAYIVSTGGVIPDLKGKEPDENDVTRGMEYLETGKHSTSLPYQSAAVCREGYDIIERGSPNVKPIGDGTWNIQAYFTFTCTE